MKIGREGVFHLTYCSNIHAGESWSEVFESLKQHALPLKKQLSPDAPFGLGLRLSNEAAETLLTGDHLEVFRTWMDDNGLYVFTFNGFPYGSFHRSVVKDTVYRPDWRTSERLEYTLRLCKIMAELLPDGMEGGISTSPLSYKPWLNTGKERREAFETGTRNLVEVTEFLANLREEKGQLIHIDIEPEPDCLIENIAETVAFFKTWLFPRGGQVLAERMNISPNDARELLRQHIRLCYDTCHFAVEYESAKDVLKAMQEAEIKIGKVQISAAVQVQFPRPGDTRTRIAERLNEFVESTYLHQVVERRSDLSFKRYRDLHLALPHVQDLGLEEWRIHFHVPIFIDDYNGMRSTQADITEALNGLIEYPLCSHLEIETYTWEVLPDALKQDLTTSIFREYQWVLGHFQDE